MISSISPMAAIAFLVAGVLLSVASNRAYRLFIDGTPGPLTSSATLGPLALAAMIAPFSGAVGMFLTGVCVALLAAIGMALEAAQIAESGPSDDVLKRSLGGALCTSLMVLSGGVALLGSGVALA